MRVVVLLAAAALCSGAIAQESKVQLREGPGKDKAMQCMACHSVDYIQMNSRFLDRAGWTAEVNKMVSAFGAPIAKDDIDAIVAYLAQNYGKPVTK